MKAIVYTSQTGHTQRYAQMLAERTGVPAYSLKEAGKSLRRGEEIFYMGWLMAGTVKGLQSAMDRYTIRGAAIVGVSPQGNGDLWTEARINGGYSDSGGRLFYLQGGYAPDQFYCSDLNNLKGNSFIFLAFSVRTLIPLQIKDNIIHKCRSFLFPLSASIMYSFCMVNLLLQDVAVTPFTAATEFL